MARLTFEVKLQNAGFIHFIQIFPDLMDHLLKSVGVKGRLTLKGELLAGQAITLRKHPADKAGRHTISSSVTKRSPKLVISSYPTDFFETGRLLRSGVREPGKYIITRKLKGLIDPRLQGWVSEFERETIDREAAKA